MLHGIGEFDNRARDELPRRLGTRLSEQDRHLGVAAPKLETGDDGFLSLGGEGVKRAFIAIERRRLEGGLERRRRSSHEGLVERTVDRAGVGAPLLVAKPVPKRFEAVGEERTLTARNEAVQVPHHAHERVLHDIVRVSHAWRAGGKSSGCPAPEPWKIARQ